MAYAHTNVDIKPVFGVDFKPDPVIVAQGDQTAAQQPQAQRPPTLTPEAARKLLDLADLLSQSEKANSPVANQTAPLPVTDAPAESL